MRKLFILLLLTLTQTVCAQLITGVVVDEKTGETIPYPSILYKEEKTAVSGDESGHFSILRHNDEYLTFSAVGYKTLNILIGPNTPDTMHGLTDLVVAGSGNGTGVDDDNVASLHMF